METKSSADFVRMTREALAAAGFLRRQSGGMVWWEGGAAGSQPAETEDGGLRARRSTGTTVLLHGVNDHAGTWFRVAPALAASRRVIIPDLAGHGESQPAEGPIPMSLVIEGLETLLCDERDLILVGNSFGGWIALHCALRNPDRVAALVLESSGGLARPLAVPLVAQSREQAEVILRAVHGPQFVPQEWVVDALLQRASGSPMLRLTETLEHDIESRLREIRTPATLIWGRDDGVLPLSYARDLQRAIPGATLHVIDGAAHIPHLQRPEQVLACLTAISSSNAPA